MCRRITCQTCNKPSFAGCGRHVESVLAGVAPADRCQCRSTRASDAAREPAGNGRGSLALLKRLLGRGGP